MRDVSQGLVRVQPSRLKQLKKIISSCDREIQQINSSILQAKNSIYNTNWDIEITHLDYWKNNWQAKIKKRENLDEKRKKARLEIKGYVV